MTSIRLSTSRITYNVGESGEIPRSTGYVFITFSYLKSTWTFGYIFITQDD